MQPSSQRARHPRLLLRRCAGRCSRDANSEHADVSVTHRSPEVHPCAVCFPTVHSRTSCGTGAAWRSQGGRVCWSTRGVGASGGRPRRPTTIYGWDAEDGGCMSDRSVVKVLWHGRGNYLLVSYTSGEREHLVGSAVMAADIASRSGLLQIPTDDGTTRWVRSSSAVVTGVDSSDAESQNTLSPLRTGAWSHAS